MAVNGASKTHRKSLGRRGETLAARMLRSKGYVIRGRNFHTREGEIDLIAESDGVLIFVEVKTARSGAFGHPADKVDLRKQRRMALAAEAYLLENRLDETDCRFDVIAIRIGKSGPVVEHIEDAFEIDTDGLES